MKEYQGNTQMQIKKLEDELAKHQQNKKVLEVKLAKQQEKYKDLENIVADELLEK
jgi:hypothetical protein